MTPFLFWECIIPALDSVWFLVLLANLTLSTEIATVMDPLIFQSHLFATKVFGNVMHNGNRKDKYLRSFPV